MPAMSWSPTASIAFARAAASRCGSEPLPPLYPQTRRDIAADGGACHRRWRRVRAAAGIGATGSGLSDDPGRDVLSGGQSRCDGHIGDRAARAAVRPDAWPQADDVNELVR